jgi:lipopolysaccharide export system protein LptA
MSAGHLLLALALLAPPLAAQQRGGRTCRVQVDSVGRTANFVTLGDGTQRVFAGGGVYARCLDEPTTMDADSMAYFETAGELRFLGRVHFRDSVSTLDADRVTYWLRQERLVAEGNVTTRNLRTGSEMRGPFLDYLRAVPPVRDTIELYAHGRPAIRFQRESGPPAGEPFVIVADRVRMRHTDRMWGSGRVTIDRSDLSARADSAILNLADSVAYLIGSPEVVGRDTSAPADSNSYRLTAHRIRFDLTGRQDIRRAFGAGRARAVGPDWTLRGDTLDIAFDSARVQRAQAWGMMDDVQPSAHSGLSVVLGDSLDIQLPGQVMREVWAYRRGLARTRPDSTVVEEDWLAGDTLRAVFAVADTGGAASPDDGASADTARAGAEPARGGSEVELVVASGSARAYYHVDNEREPGGPRGVSYSRGQRIRIHLQQRRVRTVDVVGQVDGVYLEPLPTRAPADTSAADTTSAPERPRRSSP